MTVTSTRRVTVIMTGDIEVADQFSAADNADSPGAVEIKTLAIGANTVTVPTGGTTVTGCTIIPPAANTNDITLKGLAADTGIIVHPTDPTSIALDSTVTSFVLNAEAETIGVRLVWT